jgi:hypothetical protein
MQVVGRTNVIWYDFGKTYMAFGEVAGSFALQRVISLKSGTDLKCKTGS